MIFKKKEKEKKPTFYEEHGMLGVIALIVIVLILYAKYKGHWQTIGGQLK